MYHPTRLLALSLLIYLSALAHGAPPPFPKLRDIATSFETSVELTDQIQQTTAIAKEYYDFNDQKGRLEVLAVGQKITYFFDGKQDQIFTVDDSSCVEDDGGTYELDLFYGWSFQNPLYAGPSALILNAESKKPVYVSSVSVRSILCNQYHSETVIKNRSIVIDYYFSDPSWITPFKISSGPGLFPIRISISDTSTTNTVDQIVDFVYFRPNLNDKSKLQPPVGLGCWMKQPYVDLPVIPKQYTFGAEGFDVLHDEKETDTDVPLYRVWYDSRLKIGRLDRYTGKGMSSDLSDFKTGVQYHMHNYRTCVIRPLRNSLFLTYEADSLVGRMKDPQEVLELDGEFYSLGEADVRGVKCQVFEKAVKNVAFRDVDYKLLVTTVYFAAESVKIQVDGEDVDSSPPIDIRITGYGDENKVLLKRQFQIFSFDDEPGREFYSTFPVDRCFPASKQKSYFVVLLDATPEIAAKFEGQSLVFYEIAESVIINVANITRVRLPFIKIDYRVTGISISGLMLDKPPALSQFWKLFDDPVTTDETAAFVISFAEADEESCAAACVEMDPVKCKGFHFCGSACFLNTGEISDKHGETIPIGSECYIYIRAVSDSVDSQASLETALDNLVKAKDKGSLTFDSPVEKDETVLIAMEVITSFSKNGESISDYPYTIVKDGFQLKGDVETTLEIVSADSEQECYRQCKDATTISCASFSYCAKASNKMCRISSVLLGGGPKDNDEIVPNVNCGIFSLLYLDFFEAFEGRVFSFPGDKNVKDVDTAEECAKNCKEETSFTCRGFEYCKSKSTCALHSKHVLDLKPGESIPPRSECVHYAAKFVADYRDMGYLLIDDESNVRTEISLEECARACSEEVSNCNSFNYCPASSEGGTDSTCSFTSKTLYNSGPTKTKGKCHLYTKREHIEDWKVKRSDTKEGYTRGGFAGLLIGMIVLGLVIGSLLFVAYSYYRTRRGGDGLTVKFSKQENM